MLTNTADERGSSGGIQLYFRAEEFQYVYSELLYKYHKKNLRKGGCFYGAG